MRRAVRRVGPLAMLAAIAGVTGCYAPPPMPPAPPGAHAMADEVAYLADPERDGRALGTEGRDEAAQYIEAAMRRAGLQPGLRLGCGPGSGGAAARSDGVDPGVAGYSVEAACGTFVDSFTVRPGLAVVDGLGMNIVGIVPGTDPALRGQVVVVGAHYDHIGRLHQYSRDPSAPGVRPGADDNASGTAVLLELARRIAARPLPRSVLFAAFDAEELGLIGSAELLGDLPFPNDSMVAMLNLDMVGRMRGGRLEVRGTGTWDGWEPVVQGANRELGLELRLRAGGGRSDHVTFRRQGIPALHFFTGTHRDYHRRGDVVERVNFAGMLRVAELVEDILRELGEEGTR